MPDQREIDRLLNAVNKGRPGAEEDLFPLIYNELHRLAEVLVHTRNPNHTLQPTALVHEAYLRLIGDSSRKWEKREHFFRIAAKAMRYVLIDYSRKQMASKRSGGWRRFPLEAEIVFSKDASSDILLLNDALNALSEMDPKMAQIVELRFFGGMTLDETAQALDISCATVKRKWTVAKAWLRREISGDHEDGS